MELPINQWPIEPMLVNRPLDEGSWYLSLDETPPDLLLITRHSGLTSIDQTQLGVAVGLNTSPGSGIPWLLESDICIRSPPPRSNQVDWALAEDGVGAPRR
jgi:hypothetical protein